MNLDKLFDVRRRLIFGQRIKMSQPGAENMGDRLKDEVGWGFGPISHDSHVDLQDHGANLWRLVASFASKAAQNPMDLYSLGLKKESFQFCCEDTNTPKTRNSIPTTVSLGQFGHWQCVL